MDSHAPVESTSATIETTVAQLIVQALVKAGVRYVFGLPGGETVELLDELRLGGIEFVLVHNESSAIFMADSYARITATPAVCLTTLGPGATNAAVGLAHAYLDRVPVILITAQKPDTLLPDYTHQVLDLQAFFRPITKATIKVNAHNASAAIHDALLLVQSGRPGPVHLQLSNEDAAQVALSSSDYVPSVSQSSLHANSEVANATQLFSNAKRPIIVAGLGLEPQRPYHLLRELAEQAHAPIIVTPKGKGTLPDDHPLSAGVIGVGRNDPAYQIIDEADCVLAVGFDVVELVRPWKVNASLIWLAPWENVDPVVPAVATIVGDMHEPLKQLIDREYAPEPEWGAQRVHRHHLSQVKPLPSPAPGRLLPQNVLVSLRTALPSETNLSVDVGSHKILSSLEWPTLANNSFFLSNGISSMGFALPSAIGAHFAAPHQPSVCITGDAGMAMVMGELGIVAQRRLPLLIIVFNDGAIDLIRSQQVRAGKPVYGTTFESPNFSQIASAYGITSARVSTMDQLDHEFRTFALSAEPRVVEVMIDPISYPTTPHA